MMLRYRVFILPLVLFSSLSWAQTDSLIHSGYHIEQSKILLDSGLYEQAVQELRYVDPRDTNYVYSLTELANVYYVNDQYDEAIATAKKGLLQPSPYRSRLLTTQGMAYAEKEDYTQALATFETGLKEFPFYSTFPIQYGKVLYTQKQYVEAEKYFFRALETTPFHPTPHLYLGIISMLRGEKTRGMMAMGMYMAINNTANSQLLTLERFVKNELTDELSIPRSTVNPFARLDEIIRSKIVMDDRYKTRIPIDAGIVKQYQLMLDQIATEQFIGDDPWLTVYLPIYKSLIKANGQEAFIYHILKSTSIKQVSEWTKKNEKALTQFYTAMNTAVAEIRATKMLPESWGYKEKVSCWYDDSNRLDAIGQRNDKKERTGNWYYYHDNGSLQAQGKFEHDRKTGVWKYFNSSSVPIDVENFDTGERMNFYEQGQVRQKYFLKNGVVEGDVFNYYPCGTIKEHMVFKKGTRQGPAEVYSSHGVVIEKYTWANDSLHGKYQSFFTTGERHTECTYAHGVLEKTFTTFHQNGKIASQGEYVSGDANGPWKNYHDNGKLKEVGAYKGDLPVGKFTYYDRTGAVIETRNYDEKGQLQGENLIYNNGVLDTRLTYRDHILIEAIYYDLKGKTLATSADAKGNLQGKAYYITGELRSEFNYAAGKPDGTWKFYYRSGNLENTYEYKDGKLNGKATEYYADKTVKTISYYKDGEFHGPYKAFHENGKPRIAGWYQDGLLQQRWLYYYPNGKIKTDDYYLNNLLTGVSIYYDPEGKIISTTEYQDEKVVDIQYYNEKGEVSSAVTTAAGGYMKVSKRFKSGAESFQAEMVCGDYQGKLITYLPGGKPYLELQYANDKRNGAYRNAFPDGSLECTGEYRKGDLVGSFTWYHPNKSVETIGRYVAGEKDSLWTYYHENGKLSRISSYKKNKLDGPLKFFGPDGQLILEKRYHDGDLIAYRLPNRKDTTWTSFSGTGTIKAHYPDGQLAFEEKYVNHQLDGSRKLYFMNGVVYAIDNYINGLSEGSAVINHPNGKSRLKKNYKMDEPEGRWEYYSLDGKLEKTENYSVGLLHGPAEFFSNGKKVKEVRFWYGVPTE